MASTFFLLSLALVGSVVGDMTFSLTDCSQHRETELLTFPQARVSPYPVGIPGDLSVTGSLRLNRNTTGSMTLDLTVERYVGFFWLTVPCISDVGSCTYHDACALMNDAYGVGRNACPQQISGIGLPCTCPFTAGTYSMSDAVFTVPEMSGIYSWLAEGDYRVTAKLIDNPTGQELACQHLEGTIVDGHPACSGFLCSIFG